MDEDVIRMRAERLILTDAIRAAIKANRIVIIQRYIIAVLTCCLVVSVGARYGQKPD